MNDVLLMMTWIVANGLDTSALILYMRGTNPTFRFTCALRLDLQCTLAASELETFPSGRVDAIADT